MSTEINLNIKKIKGNHLLKNGSRVYAYTELIYKNDKTDKEPTHTLQPQDSVDLTARVIGDFGRWQFWISFFMSLLKLPIAWYQLNIIFMAPPQDFWCAKPERIRMSEEEWRHNSCPVMEEHPCLIYDPDYLVNVPDIDKTLIPLVPCIKFIYDQSVFNRTITSDWDLVCSKHWLIHLTQFIMMWGIVFGGIIFGIIADKYGRKTPLMVGILVQSVCSYIATFMQRYWWFLANWFLLALASGGVGIISFVICMETASGKYRTIVPVLYQLPFGLGSAVMSMLAYWLRDWRKLEFALASLSGLFILCWFVLPESPRWLLATGQTDKAFEVLKKAAKCNKRKFDSRVVEKLLYKTPIQKQEDPGFSVFFKTKKMRMKTTLLSVNWFCTGLSFYTFSQYVGSIGNNVFLAVSLSGIISVFGGILCVFVISTVGRKNTVGFFQLITAICFVLLLFIPKDVFEYDWPRLLCAGIGFAGMAGSIPALYLFTAELFPTLGRNVGVSGVTMFARLASMMAPAVVSLDSLVVDLALILLTIMSCLQILLLLLLPETKGLPLPDTLEQAEQI